MNSVFTPLNSIIVFDSFIKFPMYVHNIKLAINNKHGCYIMDNNNNVYGCSLSMNTIYKMFKGHGFYKFHKSKFANLNFISLNKKIKFNYKVIPMMGGHTLNVGYTYARKIAKEIKKYHILSWMDFKKLKRKN